VPNEFVNPCLVGRWQIFEISFNVSAKRMKIHPRAADLGFLLVVRETAGKGRRPAHSGSLRYQLGKQRLIGIATNHALFEEPDPED
jgi:hypothetical protein